MRRAPTRVWERLLRKSENSAARDNQRLLSVLEPHQKHGKGCRPLASSSLEGIATTVQNAYQRSKTSFCVRSTLLRSCAGQAKVARPKGTKDPLRLSNFFRIALLKGSASKAML